MTTAKRNPNDRTSQLHPCHVQAERLANGQFYAYGWGGGLAEAVVTEAYDTKEEAFEVLERELVRYGRKPE